MARNTIIERYSFISLDDYDSVKNKFPNAVSCGNSKIIQYTVNQGAFEILESDYRVIVSAIESGLDRVYNCDHTTALSVANHFKKEDA
ncbi:hypothetical protein [Pseudoalteromonas sp.]|uniref:hypothetical protein n=1 Tax=Pseudoalteromonas sp. TaxID=53249 RepID=UPI003D0BF0E9